MKKSFALIFLLFLSIYGIAKQNLHIQPPERVVTQGEATFYTVTVHDFPSECGQLSVQGLPSDITVYFDDNPLCRNGQSVSTKLNISTTLNTPPGIYPFKVKIIFSDAQGTAYEDEATLIVEGKECPGFSVMIKATPESGRAPLEVQFKAKVTEKEGSQRAASAEDYTYHWDFTDGNTSEEKKPVHTFEEPGIYIVKLTVTNICGHTEEAAIIITVLEGCPPFNIEINADPEEGIVPLEVQFQAIIYEEDKVIYTYSWDFGDGNTSNEKDPLHTYLSPGIYQVVLEVENECGEKKKAEIEIRVYSFKGIIGKSFSQSEALPGDEVIMTLQLENDADYDFENVIVWDDLSKYFVYLRDNAPVAHRCEGKKIIWEFASLKKGEKISFEVTLKVSDSAPSIQIDNIAYLDHQSIEKPIPSNKAILKILQIKAQIEKSVNKNSARPGEELLYRIKIKNDSSVALNEVQIKDELSNHLEFLSQESSFDFSLQGNTLLWKGKIEANEVSIIKFSSKIKENIFASSRIANTATIEAKELAESINSNTVFTVVSSEPISLSQIKFSKKAEIPQADVGSIIRYRLVIENRSSSSLIAPTIEDNLPQGFSYVPSTCLLNNSRFADPQGSRRLFWSLPDIRLMETVILRYQVVIGTDARRGRNINRAILRAKDNSGQDILLEASEFINVSASSFIFYSGVEGYVYLDKDNDATYSAADEPVESIEVRLSTGEKAYSNSQGHYSFETLYPGEYAVGINTRTLSDNYELATPSPVAVVLPDGLMDMVNFGLSLAKEYQVKPSSLEGIVFFDKNANEKYEIDEPLLQEFRAILDGTLVTMGKEGRFVFSHIEEGNHLVEISYDTRSIKWDIELKKAKNIMYFPLKFSGIRVYIKREP